jgi:hypothetical protein
MADRRVFSALCLLLAATFAAPAGAQQPAPTAPGNPPAPAGTITPPAPAGTATPPAGTTTPPAGTVTPQPEPANVDASASVKETGAAPVPEEPTKTPGAEGPAEKPAELPVIPNNRLYLASLSVVRLNPLGLETQNRLVFQRRLMESQSLLFRDTFVSGAASLKLNPAFLKVGPIIELQPIAVLNIRAGYEFVPYFGSFGNVQSYPNPTIDYSDDARKKSEDRAYSTTGHHVLIEPTLQAKVKSVAIRSKLAVEYWAMNVNAGDTTFYDATLDTHVPANGLILANDTDVLYLAGKLTAGIRFSGVWPIYQDADFGPTGKPEDFAGTSHMRVGPLLAYSLNTKEFGSTFNKPTVLANIAWYVDHPNREGGLPYILVGFAFSSDLLPSN